MKLIWHVENGPALIEPTIYRDDRGYFYESFNEKEFNEKTGNDFCPIQDNQSKSSYGVLRGMHFQKGKYAQAKLVRVINGSVVDVIVDCRPDSPNFGRTYYAYLSADNHRQFFVPRGFAHGFITLEDDTIFQYKCDNYYNKESEDAFSWDSFGFDWFSFVSPEDIKLSEKDSKHDNFIGKNFSIPDEQ